MKPVATIILNRNLPGTTNKLCEHIFEYDNDITDVFVVEAGSDNDKISKYCTWHCKTDEVREQGLRYGRGMNFGLLQLFNEKKFYNYDAFFLLTNDTEFKKTNSIKTLYNILNDHKRLGILSPCSNMWGEKKILGEDNIKYFWYIHNNAYLIKRNFIENIIDFSNQSYINFLFDGTNFRGYGTESELIAKAYINDWGAAITSLVNAEENEHHLKTKFDLIKTNNYEENLEKWVNEGNKWMFKKYGFKSKWSMYNYVKAFYDIFFENYPELRKYSL